MKQLYANRHSLPTAEYSYVFQKRAETFIIMLPMSNNRSLVQNPFSQNARMHSAVSKERVWSRICATETGKGWEGWSWWLGELAEIVGVSTAKGTGE